MLYHYAECHVLFVVQLNVVMLSVFTLNVIMLSVFTLSVIMLSVVMLNVVMLNVFMLSVGTKILAAPFLAPKRLLLHSNSYLPSYFHSELGLLYTSDFEAGSDFKFEFSREFVKMDIERARVK